MFTCCSFAFSTEADLTAHLWSPHLHPRGNYSCYLRCGASFRTGRDLAQHRQQDFHLTPPITPSFPFRCTVCREDFQDLRVLDRHMDIVMHNLPCRWCSEIQVNQYEWDSHLLLNHREMLEQYPGTIYSAVGNYILTNESVLDCELCDRQFCLMDSFQKHLDLHPEAFPPSTVTPAIIARCNTCARNFSSQSDMDQHISVDHAPIPSRGRGRPAHPQPAVIRCLQCDRTFGTQQALQQHCQASHTAALRSRRNQVAAPQFPCHTCPGVFPTQFSLAQHTATAHPARARILPAQFSCNMCSKSFINQYALDQHMASAAHPGYVQQGRKTQIYKCQECPRTFEVKDMLTLHAASHVTQRLGRQ